MKLGDIVSVNSNFKNAINLYLNLNKADKISSYIPTASSVAILDTYIETVVSNNGKANILIGPYGKGKSHLLLVLLALLSKENDKELLSDLVEKVGMVDKNVAAKCRKYLKSDNKVLPVIVSNSQDDLRQTFMIALYGALQRVGLDGIMPNTFFSEALSVIKNWKANYKDTYDIFVKRLKDQGKSIKEFSTELSNCDEKALSLFKKLYPDLTSGSEFNPLAGGDVLIMYKSVAEKLKEYGYSGVYIVFDEFSKYIEAQSKNSVGQNMKLVQDICELSDDSKDPQIFITLVTHKAIKEYGQFLPEVLINAFSGIEGRIREIEFVTSFKNNYELIKNALNIDEKKIKNIPGKNVFFGKKVIDDYYSIPAFQSNFKRDDFESLVVKGCYPLNPCASFLLLNTSEKVAQNERTLFTFISKDENYSLAQYVKKHTSDMEWIISAGLIYDYFKSIFRKEVTEEYIHNEWLNAEYALKKVKKEEERLVLKTIAILNVVNKFDDMPTVANVIKLASGVNDAEIVLDNLEQKKILYKNQTTNCYHFKTRAGSELKKEIQKRRELKGEHFNIPESMSRVSDIHFILPRQYNYKFAMTRYYNYQFMMAKDFLSLNSLDVSFDKENRLDGIVFALFSLDGVDYTKEIKNFMRKSLTKNVVVIYTKKPFALEKELIDYEIVQEIRSNAHFMSENEVLQKELGVMEEDLEGCLKSYINENLGSQKADIVIYHDGNEWISKESFSPEKAVDKSCSSIYTKTLRINNELINKHNIYTAPIKKARRTIIERILKKNIDDTFINGTGPESTIYRAVLLNTGIEAADNSKENKQFLDIFTNYIDSCVENRIPLKKLMDDYYSAPFGMRAGVLPIILAFVISYRNEDIVIYHNDYEVELSPDVILDMCENPSSYELFISESDSSKEEYLKKLIEIFDPDCYASLTGTRISNVFVCMQRWYRSLPQVTKNLKQENMITGNNEVISILPALRTCLQRADSNAFETIFITIPQICGTDGEYDRTIDRLKKIKTLLNAYYDVMQDYLVSETKSIMLPKGKVDLQHSLKEWYDKQSDSAKNCLSDTNITVFMNCIKDISSFDEREVIQKLAKCVTGIYMDSWGDETIDIYLNTIKQLKEDVESIKDNAITGKQQIVLTNANGVSQKRFFEAATDPSAGILKNILSDTLDDFSGMSLNDRVAVLVEMLENMINKDV